MSSLSFLLRSSWIEFRQGVSSGIVTFTFVGLCLYLAITLLNAEYMQQLGATDVTRNAATVIYLMVTGFAFFMFFAYAWIFAQPILRDRGAELHEIMLTMPINMTTLLWGRFIGACLSGTVLASAVLFGFTIAPVMEWAGWLPSGSFSAIPWNLYAFTMAWLIIPTCMGVGAIYMMITLYTRTLAGPMGAAVLLILLWMLSAAILVEGDISTTAASILDPSVFSFALAETQYWTPTQKQSAYLPLSDIFLINRLIWGVLPVLLLGVVIKRISREHLISSRDKKAKTPKSKISLIQPINSLSSVVNPTQNWLQAFFFETRWQLARVINNKAIWAAILVLLCVGISNTFIHVIWHAEGPLLPDPGMTQTALGKSLHLVLFFIIAGVVGIMCRRDHIAGIGDMLDGLATPTILRSGARALAVVLITTLLTMTPALSAIIVTLLTDANYLNVSFAFATQLLVILPSQIECAMVVFFVHALVRRTGLAYGASMFVVALLIANHELELINYPPFELGIPARFTFSSLTQWAPWLDYVLLLGFFKWMLCLLLFGIAITVIPRGKDSRFESLKHLSPRQLINAPAMVIIVALTGTITSLSILNNGLVEQGGYKTVALERADNARWEKLWVKEADQIAFDMQGGHLHIKVDTERRSIEGLWQLNNFQSKNGILYAQAPHGMEKLSVTVDGRSVESSIEHDLIKADLQGCNHSACSVVMRWQTKAEGWSTEAVIPWFNAKGIWASASQFAPILGIDPNRIVRSKLHREHHQLALNYTLPSWYGSISVDGIAPSANWTWQVEIVNHSSDFALNSPLSGRTSGPLDVLISGASTLTNEQIGSLSVWSTPQDKALNQTIADDVMAMQKCVERRLNTSINVAQLVRTPGDGHASQFINSVLHLAEAPYWHVASGGIGHKMRQADIAQLLARRHIMNAYPMRESSGSLVLTSGLSGAIGMLCVGDTHGVSALSDIAKRYSEATTHAFASSKVPVGELKNDVSDGWAMHYAKLALLTWTAKQSPEQLSSALSKLSYYPSFDDALVSLFGQTFKQSLLGLPYSSSFEIEQKDGQITLVGERRRWENGGWRLADSNISAHQIIDNSNGVRLSQKNKLPQLGSDANNSLLFIIDELPAYQPSGLSVKYDN
ncbi:MAG: hypothetical protein VX100_13960 [Pseudomonadota bacterium]|nr:hypothetical protein [Pseudomonadota bacterium]